jgi:hypothetical protein
LFQAAGAAAKTLPRGRSRSRMDGILPLIRWGQTTNKIAYGIELTLIFTVFA